MSEVRTYMVMASEPGDPEDSLRAMNEEGEVFLFTGVNVAGVTKVAADFEENRKENDNGGK